MGDCNQGVLDLEDFEEELQEGDIDTVQFSALTESNIVPNEGYYLGLDISLTSTGICFYCNGAKTVANFSFEYDEKNPHAETKIRYDLKDDLYKLLKDTPDLDVIVIEDVYEGENPQGVRKLYALNTAIDELILDGSITCKEFIRVQNSVWKSWLSIVDAEGTYKGFKDKEKVQRYLEMVGITEEGKGFQDRLDATGMLIGYFLGGRVGAENDDSAKLRVNFKDISFDYEPDPDLITASALYSMENEERVNIVYIGDKRISKNMIVDYMSTDINAVFITKYPVRIGLLAETIGLEIMQEAGYFGFWLSPKAKKKYKKKLEGMFHG